MRAPTTVTSDGAPGLINAITACFPASIRIRCWFHRLGNIRVKLPDEAAGEVMAHLYAVRDAPTLDAARVAADRLVNTYRREYPAAVACFADDLDALLAIHRVPVRHRIRVRTTNLADRWCRVSISDLERHQLTLLRTELGLDPPPANPNHRKTNQHKDIAHDQQA